MAIAGAASMAMGGLNFGLFIKPMGDELGIGRSMFGWAQTARQVSSSATSPIVGTLIDRFGARVLLPASAIITGAAMVGLAYLHHSWQLVLLFADLDSLKNINDNFGHTEGDRALKSVASVLKQTFRTSDLLARLGGDEFIVLALNAPAAGVQTMTNRLQKNLDRHNSQNRYYQLSLSIGIAQFDPKQVSSLDSMIMEADKALYENKRKKRLTGPKRTPDET